MKIGATIHKSPVRHPRYATYDEHLLSYKDWPKQMKQAGCEMAEAGFFYTQRHDRVQCYYCGILLHNWEAMDIPCEEHVRHAPDCAYMNMKSALA